ncbi:MAG TPA: hypothetical protein VIN57_01535, partial [Magnetovibrio sp.]
MNVRMARNVALGAALVGSVLVNTAPAYAAGSCADREARQSLEVRVLQSELMVAALTCGERQSYNAFVTTFKPFLKSQGAELRAFFVEQFGLSAGPYRMNKMVTRLANAASQNSVSVSTQEFCAQAKTRFEQVLHTNTQGLLKLARTNPTAADHGFKTCV